jgi:protein AroM
MATMKVAFVTIGQSPRPDIMPDLLAAIDREIETVEIGCLDGLTRQEIAGGAPDNDDQERLVSRLRDGTEVVVEKAWLTEKLRKVVTALDGDAGIDLIVLLCTGYFDSISSKKLLIEPQRLVDATVDALAEGNRKVGVLVPLESQIPEFSRRAGSERTVTVSHASPYGDARFEAAGAELKDSDLLVMHCMGYDEDMRQRVIDVSGKPVLLARRLLAATVAQFV